jgi:hypothetical protein
MQTIVKKRSTIVIERSIDEVRTQVDEVINTVLPNGDIRSDFIAGMNTGGTLMQTFAPERFAAAT